MVEQNKYSTNQISAYWDKMSVFWSSPEVHFSNSDPFGAIVMKSLSMPFFLEFASTLDKSPDNLACDIGSGGVPQVHLPSWVLERTIAVDISEKMLSTNPAEGNVLTDVRESLPFLDNSFQLVTMFFVNRYISNQSMLYTEVLRILKPGGRFLSVDFSTVDFEGEECIFEPEKIARGLQGVNNMLLGKPVPNGNLWLFAGNK